jgi:2-oxoisovalerate dehydrogenase E1 component
MRRYPTYDPPEYVDWSPDRQLVREFGERIRRDPDRNQVIEALGDEAMEGIYLDLLRNRLLDVGLKRWVRQGVISKAWLGTGEEAVTVGACHALDRDRDVVCPMIRNAAACFILGMPMVDLFLGYLATPTAPSGGRDLHIGRLEQGVIQPISHMGANVPVMAGVALAFRQQKEPGVALTWIGDGATKTGECHEGLNLAAVWDLPAVFVLQDNRVALGTRAEQHGVGDLERWGQIYGIPSLVADGNHVLDVLAATRLAADRCRAGDGPVLVVARTFRMGGHATHDEREARECFPDHLFREWGRRDPVGLFEQWLLERGVSPQRLEGLEEAATREVEVAAEEALAARDEPVDPTHALFDGFSHGPVLAPIRHRGV